ncbi:MAG TPA: glycosyltransferase family 4 protein [Jatrophihabitans sp.]|nr:glycosyltransferase family 4 protein [Jatrophihabitans sp.]
MVRVLQVSWEYPPLLVGGLGRHVGMLAPQLAELGHDVRVLTLGTGPRPVTERAGPVLVRRTARLPDGPLLEQARAGARSLADAAGEVLAGWRPDVVHGHDWLAAAATELLARRTGAARVITLHATEVGRQQGWLTTGLQRRIHRVERRMCARSDAVLACSRYLAEHARRVFELPAVPRVIGNGVAPGSAAGPVGAAGERHPARIAFAGRLVHEKGLQELIKALPLLAGRHPGIELVVAGAGPLAAAQHDRAHRYGVAGRIRWLGFVDGEPLHRVLAGAAVVVVPSLYEPFGLVALEAQLAGTPVAVSDTGGLRELVAPGRTGLRFAPESPAAIAAAVHRLLTEPGRAARMARHARRRAESEFGWPAVAARTAAAYAEVRG